MKHIFSKRILMNEEGGSPGGGSAPPAPPAPTAAPTAPETPAPLTADTITNLVTAAVTAQFRGLSNELFANARKAGLLKKDETTTPTPAPSAAAPASTGLSMADVEAMLERERVVTRVATEHKLSDAQVKRMKGLLTAERPDDVSGWVSSFVTDMGLARQTETATPNQTTPSPTVIPSTAPISDRGAPASNGVQGWRYELQTNPMNMSAAAKQAMNLELGEEKARKQRLEAANPQMQRMTLVVNQRG